MSLGHIRTPKPKQFPVQRLGTRGHSISRHLTDRAQSLQHFWRHQFWDARDIWVFGLSCQLNQDHLSIDMDSPGSATMGWQLAQLSLRAKTYTFKQFPDDCCGKHATGVGLGSAWQVCPTPSTVDKVPQTRFMNFLCDNNHSMSFFNVLKQYKTTTRNLPSSRYFLARKIQKKVLAPIFQTVSTCKYGCRCRARVALCRNLRLPRHLPVIVVVAILFTLSTSRFIWLINKIILWRLWLNCHQINKTYKNQCLNVVKYP